MKILWFILSVLLLTSAGLQTAFSQTGEAIFEEALRKERAEGNLEEAITLYQRIVNEFADARRALVAHALVRMGQSYEKLGQGLLDEAREAYEKVVREYADQPDRVAEASSRLVAIQRAIAPSPEPAERGLTVRRVARLDDFMGQPSPDGRYVSYVNWNTGNLAVYDKHNNIYRDVTDEGTWNSPWKFSDVSIWSPDSRQIAYEWIDGGKMDLRIVDIEGGEPRILVPYTEAGVPWPTDWSSNGRYILAINEKHDHNTDAIVLVDVETGSVTPIKTLGEGLHTFHMSFSPDNQYIAYETFPGPGEPKNINVMSIDGQQDYIVVDHVAQDRTPEWTPDGQSIVFLSNRSGNMALWSVPVTDGAAAGEAQMLHPIGYRFDPIGFTEDGTYYYGTSHNTGDVFVSKLDLEEGIHQDSPEVVSTRYEGASLDMSSVWSPDGSKIAYLSFRNVAGGRGGGYLVIRDMASGEENDFKIDARLFACQSWSPDGTSVLTTAVQELSGWAHFLYDLDTGDLIHLAGGINNASFSAAMAPDGKSIYFTRTREESPPARLIRLDINSGNETVLRAQAPFTLDLSISPDGSQLAFFEATTTNRPRQLLVMSLEDGTTRELWSLPGETRFSNDVGIEWMPNGEGLLTATYTPDGERQQLYLINANSGEKRSIGGELSGEQQIEGLDLHPDGKTVTFFRRQSRRELWAIDNLIPASER